MVKNMTNESSSTQAIRNIVKKIDTTSSLKISVYEEATKYFAALPQIEKNLTTLQQDLKDAQQNLSTNSEPDNVKSLKVKVEQNLKKIELFQSKLEKMRLARLHKLRRICEEVLSFCISPNRDDSNKRIAKVLGTISLKAPESINLALQYNRQNQHLYQAVLSIKLLDQLLEEKKINYEYILNRTLSGDIEEFSQFRSEVQIPLLSISLLHNVGLCHPIARQILKGESGDNDEYRVLSKDERLALLRCNYQQTLNYLTDGLGLDKYMGDSEAERETFNKREEEKSVFIRMLLKSSLNPKQGIGNLIKVPQIYTSVVLSTKRSFTYTSVPKSFQMLNKGIEGGSIDKRVVDSLLKITGVFPQGYGIAFIPQDAMGYDLDRFEFAVVNTLYPQEPSRPICRLVTKNQVFISSGGDLHIAPDNNLYLLDTRKKLMKVSSERLKKILSQLWSDFESRQNELDLIPKCWHPYEFFSIARQQNLWNKV
jgi:hypothetical protein